MHEVLVNRLGGLSLPRKSVVRLTDRPDMTLDVYHGRKTTIQPTNQPTVSHNCNAYRCNSRINIKKNVRLILGCQNYHLAILFVQIFLSIGHL